MKKRIFISHSRKGDPARKPIEAVARALADAGYEATYDATFLEPGDLWYDRISREMSTCHGAVLLLDGATQHSDYVRHEASVLSYRRRTEAGRFELFVALVDPDADVNDRLKAGDLSHYYGDATRLADHQVWTAPAALLAHNDMAPLATALAETARGTFGVSLAQETPRDWAVDEIRQGLERLEPQTLLDRAVDGIGDAHADFVRRYREQALRWRPMILAQWLFATARDDPLSVVDVLERLRTSILKLEAERRRVFAEALDVAQSQWIVIGRPHCPLSQVIRDLHAPRAGAHPPALPKPFAVNGCYLDEFTLERFPLNTIYPERHVYVRCGNDSVLADEIASQIASGLGVSEPPERRDAKINRKATRRSVICLLPRRFPENPADLEVLDGLRARFPTIVFVVWGGEEAITNPHVGRNFIALHPPIDVAIEDDQRDAWQEWRELFELAAHI